MTNNEKTLPSVPPDDKGRFTPVRDGETGEITWATILTEDEAASLKNMRKKSPLHQPISANPPPTPSKN
jgi:hypothetical protein